MSPSIGPSVSACLRKAIGCQHLDRRPWWWRSEATAVSNQDREPRDGLAALPTAHCVSRVHHSGARSSWKIRPCWLRIGALRALCPAPLGWYRRWWRAKLKRPWHAGLCRGARLGSCSCKMGGAPVARRVRARPFCSLRSPREICHHRKIPPWARGGLTRPQKSLG